MGLFDQLHNQIGGDEDDGGLSPLDLRDLPDLQRKLMRHMLREVELPYEDIRDFAEGLEDDLRPTEQELERVLEELTEQRWLIRYGEKHFIYEANLRRKAASNLAKNIWASLDKRIEQQRIERERRDDDAIEDS
jgi:hypothetical protein